MFPSVFRRRTQPAQAGPETEVPPGAGGAKQAGKGRPTRKRSEVERARRQPYTAPPADKKAASGQQRERRRAEQQRRMQAMRRGEEWALPIKDRGPVKALARDYVDSRRVIVSEYILFFVFALVLLVFMLGAAKNSAVVVYIEFGIVALIAVESAVHAAAVRRLARQRYPGESTNGLTWYVAKRAIKLRSSRIPPTRVGRGQAI